MAAEQDDLEFLRNQVHRLNAALSKYQSRHPQPVGRATGEHGALTPDGPKPSWLYNKSLLVPLLSEYDDVISQQQRELQTRQEALQGLSTKLQEVCSQNSRPHQLDAGGRGLDVGGRGLDVDLVEHLQRQVESLQAESSSCRALEESGRQELSALRSAHQDACSTAHHLKQDLATARGKEREVAGVGRQLQEVCQLLKQERSDLLSKTGSQEQQLLAVRDKLSSVQRQLEVQSREAAGLTADKEGLLARLRSQEAESSEWEDRGREVEGRVHQLDVTNRSLQSKLEACRSAAAQDEQKSRLVCRQFQEDCDKLRRDNLELLQAREGLRGRLRATLQEGNSLQSSLDQQVNAVSRSKDLLEAEGAQHLQALEKKYKSKLQQLQLQLSTSQRKNTKCCSEAKALAHKFEHNLAELRSSCEGLRGHNADLAAAVDRARLEGQQLTEELVQVSRELSSCRDRLAEERSREVWGRWPGCWSGRAVLTHHLARVKLQLSKAFGEGPSLAAVS